MNSDSGRPGSCGPRARRCLRQPRWLALLAVMLGAAGCAPPQDAACVLLVTIDTLRADHLSCYGYERQTSPVIDQLAAEGTRFDRGYTTVPITLPSHSSIMTGVYPIRHGVRDNARYQHLDESSLTLAEILRDAGYQTAGVVSAFPLDRRFGIAQGFDFYDDAVDEAYLPRVPGDHPPEDPEGRLLWERQRTLFQQRANTTTDKALAWLKNRERDRPFFLWVHYFDPHHPYDPPSPFDREFATASGGALAARTAAYDGEIRYTDEEIGRLVEKLRNEGTLDRCLLVLTADHGEGLGQHRVDGQPDLYHGDTLFAEGLRVPLLIRWPEHVPAGVVIEQNVSNVDLMPTLLELLDLEPSDGVQGRSLVPLLAGDRRPSPDLFFESLLPQIRSDLPPLAAVQDDRWKLILRGEEDVELYDLHGDPGEIENLASGAEYADIVEGGRRRIREWEERCAPGQELDNQRPLDAASLEKLRALGYVSDPDPTADSPEAPR